jgi:hypothetical protein
MQVWHNIVEQDGLLIMAGILDEQAERVEQVAAQHGLQFVERRSSGDWVALVYRRIHENLFFLLNHRWTADQPIYAALVESLLAAGHEVLTAQLSSADIMEEERVISAAEVYQRDVRWVNECDALIAEVSTPSHGVGYEIALALHLGKPVLCCYHTDRPYRR